MKSQGRIWPFSVQNISTISITLVLIVTNLVILSISQNPLETYFCSQEFCDEATRNDPCPAKRECDTVGFRTFLDPSECNCCDYCFDYLELNDTCSPSSSQTPTEMCGPQLYCQVPVDDSEVSTCQPMENEPECMKLRTKYSRDEESGRLGMLQFLPECDAGGKFAPRQCIPGLICYCSDPDGNRVFGQSLPEYHQDCACSRDVAKLQSFGFEGRMPHCLPNGDYDELQCAIRSCYCRSYPEEIVNPQDINELPCFNESLHVYEPGAEPTYYIKPCELRRAEAEIEIAEAELQDITLIISDIPRCDPDGNYAAIQTEFDKQFCANPITGQRLENFEVGKVSPEAADMNCYCALARYLLQDTATGKPRCCPNGNFQPLQRIGSTWYCVDSYGRQIVPDNGRIPAEVHESEIEKLICYNESC